MSSRPARKPSTDRGWGLVACAFGALGVGCDDGEGWRVAARPEQVHAPVCIGAEPPDSAWTAGPRGSSTPQGGGGADAGSPELGEPPPDWTLPDFQPQSCGYEAVYGLEAFRGRATVVALWAGS